MVRRLSLIAACGFWIIGAVACTSLLGDFTVSADGTDGGGGVDGGGPTPDGAPGTEDGGLDGSTPPEEDAGCPFGQVLKAMGCVAVCQTGGNECSGHGTCNNTSTGTSCTCNPEYAGAACKMCSAGYQDKDTNGTCLPTCAQARLTCPLMSTCVDSSGVALCKCPIGYALEGVTPSCVWKGVLRDPGFQNVPASSWVIANAGMSFDFAANPAGVHEPGYVMVNGASMCATSGAKPNVSQKFDMPTAAESEAMSLSVSTAASYPVNVGIGVTGRLADSPGPIAVQLAWNPPPADTFGITSFCLGELQYGVGKSLELGMYAAGCGGSSVGIQGFIDYASINPDASCPRVGTIFNGDFEQAGSWISNVGGGGGAGFAGLVAAAGNNNSFGAQLSSTNDCQSATLDGKWSAPLNTTMVNLAVKFNFHGSGGERSHLRLDTPQGGGVIAGNLSGNGGNVFSSVTVCVPEYAKGYAGTLTMSMPQATTCGIAQPDARLFVFDDFQFVSDPSCAGPKYIIDGDFEGPPPITPWTFSYSTQGFSTGAVLDAGGNHYGAISAQKLCNDASVQQTFSVPPLMPNTFYKLQFKYRTTETGAGGKFTASPLGSSEVTLASTGGAWSTGSVCINQFNGRRAASISFRATPKDPGGQFCGDTLTVQSLDIDDLTGAVVNICP